MTTTTKDQIHVGINTLKAIADVIKEQGAKGMPSGHLYAALMAHGMELPAFDKAIGILTHAGLVRQSGHVLYWKD